MPIPLFPLHVVLFPGIHLPLHVFEPRYRAMMADVLGPEDIPPSDASFGVACIREGFEVGARAETHDVGCLGAVEWVRRHPDGTMDLLVRGARRFMIVDRPDDDPYPRAEVELLGEERGPRAEEALGLARRALERYRGVVESVSGSEEREPFTLPDEPVAASFAAAAALQIETPRRQELLEARNAADRLARVAAIARSEATLLETIGPPVGRPPLDRSTLN